MASDAASSTPRGRKQTALTPCRAASPGRSRDLSPTGRSVLEVVPRSGVSPRISSVASTTRSMQLGADYEELDQTRQELARSGDFRAADEVKAQLKALKAQREQALLEEHRAEHRAFIRAVEETHAKELEEFETAWEKRTVEHEGHSALMRSGLEAKHKEEHEKQMVKLHTETEPRTPRWSRDLLQLRKQQERLSDQQRYAEAADLKDMADGLEEKEQASWQAMRDAKIATAESHFLAKQQAERDGLEARIAAGRQEFELAKTAEKQRLEKRCQNVKVQTSTKYKIVGNHVEKKALVYSPKNTTGTVAPSPRSIRDAVEGA